MKKSVRLAALLVAFPVSVTFAADLPSPKEQIATPVVSPTWTGFYAGLNAGYNWGTNTNAYSQNWGIVNFPASASFGGATYAISGFNPMSTVPVAMDGVIRNTQSGFMGGAQLGYNYQYGSRVVLGVETDIQGASVRGAARSTGLTNGGSTGTVSGGGLPGPTAVSYTDGAIGSTQIQAGLDYLGTIRGRIGYLWSPALLVYGTGGFAYGGAWANVTQTATANTTFGAGSTNGSYVWNGAGQQNQLLTGWTAGAGAEWMFMPNWSLKGEALYWDLGRMNVQTASYSSIGNSIGWGRTNVDYSGVVARAGVNYHFNFGTAPVVAKF